MSADLGREDHTAPLVSWRTKANLTLAALAAGAVLLWHLAVVLTADGVGVDDVDITLRAVMAGHPLSGLEGAHAGSLTATVVVFASLVVALFAVFVAATFAWSSWRRGRRSRKGFAGDAAVRTALGLEAARAKAAQTRPSLTGAARRRAAVEEVGLGLGESDSGEPVVLPLEDHALIVAPTGAGKSRDLMIPAAATAPGALVITCTRADILDVIATRRARLGRVWVFDPLERTGWPERMVWDPVAGCRDGERATSRGLAFASGLSADDKGSTNAGFFQRSASSALTRLLHAADLDHRPIADVVDWAMNLEKRAAVAEEIIRTSTDPLAEPMWAGLLRSVATGADDTVASSRQTLQQALEPLAMRKVLAWVTPTPGIPVFDPAAFVGSTDTLVLVADQNTSTNVAPLCAMLLQEVVDAAKTRAARLPGGRLDPPLRIVGDEIANVAPLPNLPDLGTDARGFGMQLILAVQSIGQVRRRWGTNGANALIDNMAAELALGGLTDTEALGRYAALVGEVELTRSTTSYDTATGRATSTNEQTTSRKALRPEEARQIPDGHALLIYRNQPPILLRMTPWYARPDGKQLTVERDATQARRLAPAPPEVVTTSE